MATIDGTSGDDSLVGSTEADRVDGGAGSDTMWGGAGRDTLIGGLGSDLIYGGAGSDFIQLNDPVYSGEGTGYGGSGNDYIALFGTSDGWAHGGDGIDTLGIGWSDSLLGAVHIDFSADTPFAFTASGRTVTFSSMERLSLYAGTADDTVTGGIYSDHIAVGRGGNWVDAAAGDDTVSYVLGQANTLVGGEGDDVLVVSSELVALQFTVDGVDGTADDGGLSVITGFERYDVRGAASNDQAVLGTGADTFRGAAGDDSCAGQDGDDLLLGARGNDSLVGGAGADRLRGNVGDDTLLGGAGNDLLAGGVGSDLIAAGDGDDRVLLYLGNDTVSGEAGADQFVLDRNQSGAHLILDFESGTDRLEISTMLLQFMTDTGALDPGRLNMDAAVGTQAQFVLTYDANTDRSSLVWDPNGEAVAGGVYLVAYFAGPVGLAASDILIL